MTDEPEVDVEDRLALSDLVRASKDPRVTRAYSQLYRQVSEYARALDVIARRAAVPYTCGLQEELDVCRRIALAALKCK